MQRGVQALVFRSDAFKAEPRYGSGKVAPVVRQDSTKGFNLNRIAVKQFVKIQ